jgi:hypothetical protein
MWDSIQQIVRIVMYMVSGYLVKMGWPEDMTVALTGGAIGLATVGWWFFWERKRVTDAPAA